MNLVITFLLAVLGLFAAMLALMEMGWRIGVYRKKRDAKGAHSGLGAIEGAVYGLMGLLVAFTFSGAASRFDARRELIGHETNDIGTAYLRVDLLPPDLQPAIREDFRNYVDARLGYYRNVGSDEAAAKTESDKATALQGKIWSESVAACQKASVPSTTSLVLSSINSMIDVTTTRAVAFETHPPAVVFWGMGILVLASALLAGYSLAEAQTRSLVHMFVYSAIFAIAVYVIIDLEFPRVGLIRIDSADHFVVDLRNNMR